MDTKDEIKYYVEQKSSAGALLVTGKWGCGKTYLIRKIIDKLNNGKEYVAVLISSFGIDSIELLHNEIKNKVFFSRGFEKENKKFKKIFSKVKNFSVNATDILGETFSIAKSVNKSLTIRWQDYFNVGKSIICFDVKSENKKHLTDKELVLFFDDFERCKLDRIELMGVLNDYSENRKIKVIIIADEDKITVGNKEESDSKEDENENNECGYSEFKEKLISRTIKIKTDYKTTIDSIINSYEETESGYKDFLLKNKELISLVFSESKTDNFRSVRAFITDYERVYGALKGLSIDGEVESNLFYNFGALVFGVKNGIYKEGEYGFLFSDVKVKELFSKWNGSYVLNSFQNWGVYGIWNKENFVNEVRSKFNKKELSAGEKFVLYNLWDLNQTDIESGIPEVTKMAYAGALTRDQLISFLQKIHYLRDCLPSMPCDIDYSKIEEGFELRKKKILTSEITEPRRQTFLEKIKWIKKHINYMML